MLFHFHTHIEEELVGLYLEFFLDYVTSQMLSCLTGCCSMPTDDEAGRVVGSSSGADGAVPQPQ